MATYKIVRHYLRHPNLTIETGLTLEQVQEHCRNPETSSSTCQKIGGKRRTAARGPWFDGYDVEL